MEEHQAFSASHAQCMTWVDTLRRRLQVCADLAGDKQDVEDRTLKLQVSGHWFSINFLISLEYYMGIGQWFSINF